MTQRSAKSEIAVKGEELATTYLKEKGYKILHRNWRFSRLGEIDIIAKDSNTLIFVEVKTRTSRACGDPLESITPRKQRQIAKLADIYISRTAPAEDCSFRFDAISIILSDPPEIEHLSNACEYDF